MATLFIMGARARLAKLIISCDPIISLYDKIVLVYTGGAHEIGPLARPHAYCFLDLYSSEPNFTDLIAHAHPTDNTVIFLSTPTNEKVYESVDFRSSITKLFSLQVHIQDYIPFCRTIIFGSTLILVPNFMARSHYKNAKKIEYLFYNFVSQQLGSTIYIFMPPITVSASPLGSLFVLKDSTFLSQLIDVISKKSLRGNIYLGNFGTRLLAKILNSLVSWV